jgi:hypothetical protein
MTKKTFERRYQQLKLLVDNHPHKDELIAIMREQVRDDNT